MEEIVVNELFAEYNSNCNRVLSLALHTVSNIEIPVFNTLSTMSKQNILQLMSHLEDKFKNISTTAEKSLMITLITDVITSMIKHNDFYESFHGNNTHAIHLLCKKINQIVRVRRNESQIVLSYINQMTKYANRIPYYIELKKCLLDNNDSYQNISHFTVNQEVVNKSIIFSKQINCTDVNENILKDNNIANIFKRKHLEIKSESTNRCFESEPNSENINTQNHKQLQEIKQKITHVTTDQSDIKLPETKPKNAFDVLMRSARKKITKK